MHVGYRLYREVRDFAPPDLTSGELVVAWVIADDANDTTRHSWIENAELCYRTRMKPSGVRASLGRLAARGLEFRVIHGYDKNGDPVFAARGHRADYVVPDFFKADAAAAPLQPDGTTKGDTTVAPSGPETGGKGDTTAHEGATRAAPLRQKGDTTVSPLSSEDLNHLRIPSVDRPVVTASVEGTRARGEVKIVNLDQPAHDSNHALPPRRLSQAEEFKRQADGLAEFMKQQSIQGPK